jgi:hypothetical protein
MSCSLLQNQFSKRIHDQKPLSMTNGKHKGKKRNEHNMLCYVTIIYSRKSFQLQHLAHIHFLFIQEQTFPLIEGTCKYFIQPKQRRQTFLLQHFTVQDIPDLHLFIPDYDHVLTFIYTLDGQHILIRWKSIQYSFPPAIITFPFPFLLKTRRHLCTENSKGLSHYTLLLFARPKQLILFRSPPMQRRQRMV